MATNLTRTTQTGKTTTADVAAALIRAVRTEMRATQRVASIYGEYVATHGITTIEACREHAAALTARAYPNVKPSGSAPAGSREREAHVFRTKVRRGLQRAAGISEKSSPADPMRAVERAVIAAVRAGAAADEILATVTAAIEVAQKED